MSKLFNYAFSDLYDISSGISSTKDQAGHGTPFASFRTVFNNIFLQGAFLLGLILITAVMMIPQLSGIFKVQTLTWNQLWIVYGLALLNLPVIQLIKWIWKWKKD